MKHHSKNEETEKFNETSMYKKIIYCFLQFSYLQNQQIFRPL